MHYTNAKQCLARQTSKYLSKTDHGHHHQTAVSREGSVCCSHNYVTPTLHADMSFKQFSIVAYLSPPLSALLLAGSLPGYVMSRYHTS